MYKLTLDKGTATERSINLETFYERPIAKTFTGSETVIVELSSDVPDVSALAKNPWFKTVSVVNSDGVVIPVAGTYNYINDLACNYNDTDKRYTVNLTLTLVEVQNEQ